MIRAKVKGIFQEISQFSSVEKCFVLAALLCGFCIAGDYTTVRSVSNALFITSHGSKMIPYAWLATLPFNFLIIALHNRYLAKLGCRKMLQCIIFTIAGVNLCSYFFIQSSPSVCFFFYMWKEVYVLLMFQQLWSVVHATIDKHRAKYLYGLILGSGGVGGIVGSCLPGYCAVSMGSENLILFSFVFYSILLYAFAKLYKFSNAADENDRYNKENYSKASSILHSFQLVSKSSLLMFILISVVLMQLTSAFVDLQFNTILEKTILSKDLRTEYYGKTFGYVNMVSLTMQVFGTFLLLHFCGLRKTHYFVPLVLCIIAGSYLFFPTFGIATSLFVCTRGFDFSIFCGIKEMLYIPLPIDEKFRAKAIIDVFAHRSTKALAALLILSLQFLNVEITRLLTYALLSIFILWAFSVAKLYKGEEEAVPASPSDEKNVTTG